MKTIALLVMLLAVTSSAAPSPEVLRVREWRGTNEGQILTELVQLLSLPNVAANRADIAKNADLAAIYGLIATKAIEIFAALVTMQERRLKPSLSKRLEGGGF